ncbi:transmembrane protein 70 homolog, mitochondrial [Agrilus planipennis]|uniref:Transmembrane protein 70 homolog, mitochondrial n=1 Tax=Agrilus planipennis TaxID=224129 RepID=A0A1W4WLC2_AGRPL|nr:transmembrane protein 70 homolog, mitochondrial [Agrilus planipennis]
MNFTVKFLATLNPSITRQLHTPQLIFILRNASVKSKSLNKIAINCTNCIQIRNFSRTATNFNKNKENDTLKNSERIRVYTGPLATQVRLVKYFSLMTSALGLAVQPLLYKATIKMANMPIMIAAYSFVGFFTLGTPILLHLIAKKYVIHLDYKPETGTYIATTLNFFSIKKELEFKLEDVHVPDIPGMFTTFEAKKTPLFVDLRFFEDPTHYGKIMGYDKPIDLKLFQTSGNTDQNK